MTNKQRTLVFLLKDDLVLLAMKKRGFGKGKWNGVGGKLQTGESLKQAAIREANEEIGVKVKPQDLKKAATLDFLLPESPEDTNMNVTVYAYTTTKWEGDPKESEEMKPQWFKHKDIPYKDMWWDDKFWLPKVLEGKKLKGTFYFKIDPKTGEAIGDRYEISESNF